MAVYGSMLVPTKSASTSSTKGYTTQTSYTAGQNSSARLSDSAGSIIQQAANSQTNALAGLTTNLHRANDALTDAYIDHNKMVGQNMATEYRQRVNDALYGENGILTREGESTFTCRKDAEAEMKKISDELQQGMSGSIAANFFRQNTDAFISDMSVKAQQYQDKMYGKWQDDGQTAYISQSLDLALNNYKNPDAFSRHLAEATSTIRAMGKRNGVHTDMIEKNVRDNVSNTFLNAVKQALGDKDLASAQRILKQGMTTYRDPNPHDLSNPDGLEKKATADFNNRKVFRTKDADGNEVIKTVQTMTLETDDGKFIVLPTIIDGKEFTPEDAIAYSKKTGEHFGVFDTQAHADDFAQKLHENHAVQYGPGRVYMKPADITSAKALVQHEIDRRAAEAERARIKAERARMASIRSITSGKEWKDAVYRAENMNDPTALVEIQGKLRKLGEKGMADALGEQIEVTSYVSKHFGAIKELPLEEAAAKLQELRGSLDQAAESKDIKAHKLLSATITKMEKAIAGKEKMISSEANALLKSEAMKDAFLLAERDGNTDKLGELTQRLDDIGATDAAESLRKSMVELHELRMDKDKIGQGSLAEQKSALDEFGKTLSSTESSSDYTLRSKAYTHLLQQYNARVKAFKDDPGAASADVVKEDFASNSSANPNPSLAEEMKARVEVQRRNGVLPDRTMPLSKAEVEVHVSNFNTSDDKSAYLKSIEKQYGEAWPMVYRQLAQSGKFPKTFQLINNLPSYPASIVAQAGNNSSYFSSVADARNMPKTDRDYLKTSVRSALSSAIRTLTLAGDTPNATMVEDVACNLAVTYVSQDIPPSVAAKRAAAEVMNDRYNIIDTYRVPKKFDSGKVKRGVEIAISNLLEHPEHLPFSKDFKDSVSHLAPDVAKSKMRYEVRRHLIVTTNFDESGVDFRFDGMLLRDGMSARSVSFSFNDLMNLKRERGSLTESEKMSYEAKAVRPWH